MGKRMDTAAFLIFFFLIMFLCLLFTGKDARLLAVLSALSAICALVVVRSIQRKMKPRVLRKKRIVASKRVKGLIYKDNMDALNEVMLLIKQKYNIHSIMQEGGRMYFKEGASEDQYEICIIRKYKASPDDILSFWREAKKIKPIKGIVFLIPGKMDADVKLMRYKIDRPSVMTLDSAALKTLYRKYGAFEEAETGNVKRMRPIAFIKGAVNRKRALRYLAYALLLAGYYLISGNEIHIAIGAFLFFISLFSFFSNAYSDQLFFD